LWLLISCAGALALAFALFTETRARSVFLPGQTTHGHHQIELECSSCHSTAFADATTLQNACEKCHADDLQRSHDSHPKSKFLDPRNADRVDKLDARQCVTCHAEHVPEATRPMAVTLPEDYCYRCHQDIAEERPSHEGMPFASCDDAGCHNFHDNRALYEDFLAQHLDESDTAERPTPAPGLASPEQGKPIVASEFDAPIHVLATLSEPASLEATVHSRAGVNCSDCHGNWNAAPGFDVCGKCHDRELGGFQTGRHGMRTKLGLSPLAVADAVLPMQAAAHGRVLDCSSCHGAHEFDRLSAASEACRGCHADEHTRNYGASPHGRLWQQELSGELDPGQGVSCATCHLPRLVSPDQGQGAFVEHNQNANLRPSEKMVRDVCLRCHGLGFTLNSLADADLVRSNFTGRPKVDVTSLALVAQRQASSRTEGSPAP
jgi:predicted CXXCH cytochrome family protein